MKPHEPSPSQQNADRPRSSPRGTGSKRRIPLDASADLVRRWKQARTSAGLARAEVDKLEAELLALLGNNDVGTIDGEPVVVRDVEIRNGLDLPRLRQERPELWQQYPAKRKRERLKFPRRRTRTSDDQQRPPA